MTGVVSSESCCFTSTFNIWLKLRIFHTVTHTTQHYSQLLAPAVTFTPQSDGGKFPSWHADTKCHTPPPPPLKRSQRIIPHVGSPRHPRYPASHREDLTETNQNDPRITGPTANDCLGDNDITDVWEINVCERVRLRQWSVIFPPCGIWVHVYMYTEWIQRRRCSDFCMFTVCEHKEGGGDSQVVVDVSKYV